jgi:hypothetical protein
MKMLFEQLIVTGLLLLSACQTNTPLPPVATSDLSNTPFNTPITVNPANNDMPSTGATLDNSSIDLDPSTPNVQTMITILGQGTFTSDPTGKVKFTPIPGFVGTATTPYTIKDNLGQVSNPTNISVIVSQLPSRLTLKWHETLEVANLEVRFESVTDSRCPIDAVCIWEGDGMASFKLTDLSTGKIQTLELHTNQGVGSDTVKIAGITVKMLELNPFPGTPNMPKLPEGYTVTLELSPEKL